MACCTSRLVLVLAVSAAAATAVLFGGATATAAAPAPTTSRSSSSRVPGYCAAGQAIPRRPLLAWCVWYVASRSCDVVAALLPNRAVLKDTCCYQLRAVPPECRCRALRLMVDTEALVVGADPAAQRRCFAAQARFAPAVVTHAECGLRTVHGRPFCNKLDAE